MSHYQDFHHGNQQLRQNNHSQGYPQNQNQQQYMSYQQHTYPPQYSYQNVYGNQYSQFPVHYQQPDYQYHHLQHLQHQHLQHQHLQQQYQPEFQTQPHMQPYAQTPNLNQGQLQQFQQFSQSFENQAIPTENPVLSLQQSIQKKFHPLEEFYGGETSDEAKNRKNWVVLSYHSEEFILVSKTAETLIISGPLLTSVIIDCPNLTSLTIKRQKNGVSMKNLAVFCPKLEELSLKSSIRCEEGVWITSSMLEGVLNTCPEIKTLSLSYTYGILSPEFYSPGYVPIPVLGPTIFPYLSKIRNLHMDGVGEPYDGSPLIVDISSNSLEKIYVSSENVCHYASLLTPSLKSLYMTATQDTMTSLLHVECSNLGSVHFDSKNPHPPSNQTHSIAYGFMNLVRPRCAQCDEWIQGDRTEDGVEVNSVHYIKKYESDDYRARIEREKILATERVKQNLGLHSFSRGGRWSGDRERKDNVPYYDKLNEMDTIYSEALNNNNRNKSNTNNHAMTEEDARETVQQMCQVLNQIPEPDRTWIKLYKMYCIEGGANENHKNLTEQTKQLCKEVAEKEILHQYQQKKDKGESPVGIGKKGLEQTFHSKLNEYSYPWKGFDVYVGCSLIDWANTSENITYLSESDLFVPTELSLSSLSISDS